MQPAHVIEKIEKYNKNIRNEVKMKQLKRS